MDELKADLAHRIQEVTLTLDESDLSQKVETARISALETQVKVWTKRGPRYFIIQVKEQM